MRSISIVISFVIANRDLNFIYNLYIPHILDNIILLLLVVLRYNYGFRPPKQYRILCIWVCYVVDITPIARKIIFSMVYIKIAHIQYMGYRFWENVICLFDSIL